MTKILYAPTEDFIRTELGLINNDISAGSTVAMTLVSNDHLGVGDYICIGHEGSELAELQKIVSTTGNTIVTVETLKFNHKKGEPVVKYTFDKRMFYGATSIDGSFVELTADGSPMPIQVDDPQGTLLEYTGAEGYTYFKSTYYNSGEDIETDIADAVAVLADESKRYCTIYAIRKHAGLAGNPFYSDGRIEIKRTQAENEVNSMLINRYLLPLTEIPGMVSYLTELLAAGYIDYEEFGKEGEGVKWLGEARSILKKIGDGGQKLIGSDGLELVRPTLVDVLSGLPNASTQEEPMFYINDRY